MTLDDYQKASARTLPDSPVLSVLALGVTGEAGEVAEIVKKHIGHGKPLDAEHLAEELGDVLFYLAGMASWLGIKLSDVAQGNVAKLLERYPEGFEGCE